MRATLKGHGKASTPAPAAARGCRGPNCNPADERGPPKNYNASTVPIIQLARSGEGLTEQNLADIGINQLRTPLVTVPGAAVPYPVVGGPQMAEYRAFILDEDGHIDRSVEFLCPDDEAAKKYVRQFVDGHDVELWQGNRQIAIPLTASLSKTAQFSKFTKPFPF